MSRRRRSKSGFRRLLRKAYRILSVANTASYVLGAGSNPTALAKHALRKSVARKSSKLIK